ncbi:MAG: uroporphyrinogen decarboxylase family protein, partial [Armatimonadota bacterium]|nr:uroporphyrinogen decarboxylase family protein [Armatimonadota bacterium]
MGGGIQQYREACALWNGPDAHREYIERSRRDAWDLARVLDLDLIRPAYWRMPEKPTRRLDENTFFYGEEGGHWRVMRFNPTLELYQTVDHSPRPDPTFEDLERIVAATEERSAAYQPTLEHFADYVAAQKEFGSTRAVPGGGIGVSVPRERYWLEAVALRPDLVGRYLMAQAVRASKVPAVMASAGLRYLFGGGDFASKNGPFYSPKAFHDLMLPALQKISEACRAAGTYHLFASDGNLWPVAHDLFGASGVEGFYEIDRRSGMDLARLRETFPHLTLLGGVTSETLHLGTVDDVKAEVRSALAVAKEKGSIIVGCSNQIVPLTPMENFWA